MSRRLDRVQDWKVEALACGFQVKNIARKFGVVERTVRRHFIDHFGMPAKAWLDRERMALAREQIEKGEAVKAVAIDLHFKHRSSFSEYFKRHTGASPTQFCDRHTKKSDKRTTWPI